MRPKTSVRPPIIAGARRRHLSELLRTWRRQPRQRSRLLFATLLALALLSDIALVLVVAHLLAVRQPASPPPTERRIHVPFAVDAELWEPLRHWAIRTQGRTQLFENFCRGAVRDITGEEYFEDRNPLAVVVSWMLDADADLLGWDSYPFVRCEDAELRAVLFDEENNPSRMKRKEQLHGRYVEPDTVRLSQSFRDVLQRAMKTQGQLSHLEREAVALQKRLACWQRIRSREVDGGGAAMGTASAELREAYQSGDKNLFAAALTDFLDASRHALHTEEDTAALRRLAAETWLNERTPARKAMELSLLAMACLAAAALMKIRCSIWPRVLFRAGLLSCLGSLAWATAALVGWSIRDGVLLADAGQGMFFFAATTMGLGLLLALLHREMIAVGCAASVSSLGFFLASNWQSFVVERWPSWPSGIAHDACLRVQLLLLFSAYAALTLAWSVAVVAAGRVLISAPNGERLRRLATMCASALRIGVVLLVGSSLLDALRAGALGYAWHGWNVQALGTLLILPACSALLYARGKGWMQPFALIMGLGMAFTLLALMGVAVSHAETWEHFRTADAWLYVVGLVNLSSIIHAALRYYYGRQRVFDV
jgi:hypothetical protein